MYYWGIYFGYSLAYAIGNGITGVLNWRWVFFISGIAGVVVAPIILITVKEPKRTKTAPTEEEKLEKISTCDRISMILKTFLPCFMPGMFLLCIAGGIRNAGGYVWAYNTQVFFNTSGLSDQTIESYMSWIPLVAGSLGAVVGGLISDLLVKNRGAYTRIWVLIVSQVGNSLLTHCCMHLFMNLCLPSPSYTSASCSSLCLSVCLLLLIFIRYLLLPLRPGHSSSPSHGASSLSFHPMSLERCG